MALTRANTESILVRRCGKLLTAAGLDGTTVSGSNADLNDPIAWAIRSLELTVDSRTAVDDDDCARVSASQEEQFLDLAEYRALLSALQNYDEADTTINDGGGSIARSFGQIGKRLEAAIAAKKAQLAADYGAGMGTLTAGVITLQINQDGDEEAV